VSIDELAAVLGWCTVINLVLLTVSTVALFLLQKVMLKVKAGFQAKEASRARVVSKAKARADSVAKAKVALAETNLIRLNVPLAKNP
jgi:hypothetical protein